MAGDDPEAKRVVMGVVDELGFDPVDAGSIDESWRQQPGTPGYATDLDAAGLAKALTEADPKRQTWLQGLIAGHLQSTVRLRHQNPRG